jgi:hypothetical protein
MLCSTSAAMRHDITSCTQHWRLPITCFRCYGFYALRRNRSSPPRIMQLSTLQGLYRRVTSCIGSQRFGSWPTVTPFILDEGLTGLRISVIPFWTFVHTGYWDSYWPSLRSGRVTSSHAVLLWAILLCHGTGKQLNDHTSKFCIAIWFQSVARPAGCAWHPSFSDTFDIDENSCCRWVPPNFSERGRQPPLFFVLQKDGYL